MVVSTVLAFSVGNVDGVWGNIDGVTPVAGKVNVDMIGEWWVDPATDTSTGYPTRTDQRHERLAAVCGGDMDGDHTFAEWTNTTTPDLDWTGILHRLCIHNWPVLL